MPRTAEWSLDEISAQAGLPRMTAYRMIRTMEAEWFLVRDSVTNKYHLGPALLSSTYLSEGYAELAGIVRPYLEKLAEETGEAATLAIEVDGVAVSVDMIDTSRPFKREVAVGRIIGDTANSNGKIFAAFKPKEERQEILAQERPKVTPNTITDPDALARELERVAEEGVAYDLEERNVGTCAVAAPVRDQMGKVIAAISVVAPAGRFGPDDRIGPALAQFDEGVSDAGEQEHVHHEKSDADYGTTIHLSSHFSIGPRRADRPWRRPLLHLRAAGWKGERPRNFVARLDSAGRSGAKAAGAPSPVSPGRRGPRPAPGARPRPGRSRASAARLCPAPALPAVRGTA